METPTQRFSINRFGGVGRFSEMDNLAFKQGLDSSFIVSRADLEDCCEIRSQTSSMEANISTVPDVHAVAVDDPADWMITTTPSDHLPPEPFHPKEKSLLVDGVGCWSNLVEPIFLPWRLEAVNLEDISLEPFPFEVEYVGPTPAPELSKRQQSSHLVRWHKDYISRSVTDSLDSLPPLTDDHSRDSDSIGISEAVPQPEGSVILQTTQTALNYEDKAPLSPQLGSMGAAFVTQFDDKTLWPTLETSDHTNVPDRATSIGESMYDLNNHATSELEICEDEVSEYSGLWDDDSADSDSLWMSDYSDDINLLEDGHPFLLIKLAVIREALVSFQVRKHCVQGSSSAQAAGEAPSSSRASLSDTSSGKKRKREDSSGKEEKDNSKDDDDAPKKPQRASKKDSGHQVTFACPFAKKDPVKHRSCYACILKRIGDVKQHLLRCHQLPIYCPVCMSYFDTEEERDEHVRASSCTRRSAITHEGVTRAQKVQLSRRVSSKLNSADQWFTIFDILFPGHTPRPRSAYINAELTLDLEGFQDLMNAEGPTIILNAIRSRNIQMASITNEEHDLSALLRSAIEEGLQDIAQRWSEDNLDENTPGLEASGSVSSQLSITNDGAHRSQASSDTLVETLREQHIAEQPRNIQVIFPENTPPPPPEEELEQSQTLIQAPSIPIPTSSQNPAAEAQPPSNIEQQDAPIAEGLNNEQYYGENSYNLETEDLDDFWKSVVNSDVLMDSSHDHTHVYP